MRRFVSAVFLSLMLTPALSFANIADRQDVQDFIILMSTKHGFDQDELIAVFSNVSIKQSIIDAMDRPAERKAWFEYRPLFITETSINNGVNYYKKHQAALERAEKEYGVPAEIIVAIIGVETRYGTNKGSYNVIDALSTLSFEYPRRSEFFTKELEEFLLLAREEKIDPLTLKGSYAGAMGTPQFMPSSYRAYAVDFANDGRRNLWENDTDAIGSVANYLKQNGWKGDQTLIIVPADIANEKQLTALQSNVIGQTKPSTSVKTLKTQGVNPSTPLDDNALVALISYENADGSNDYWIGLHNFYVITTYNRSALYAMAVYQLAQEVKQSMSVSE